MALLRAYEHGCWVSLDSFNLKGFVPMLRAAAARAAVPHQDPDSKLEALRQGRRPGRGGALRSRLSDGGDAEGHAPGIVGALLEMCGETLREVELQLCLEVAPCHAAEYVDLEDVTRCMLTVVWDMLSAFKVLRKVSICVDFKPCRRLRYDFEYFAEKRCPRTRIWRPQTRRGGTRERPIRGRRGVLAVRTPEGWNERDEMERWWEWSDGGEDEEGEEDAEDEECFAINRLVHVLL
ncbi:hypothetical protein GSI_00040 [Ganoderma sinense ZZ0214-1]|uniref:Uncharacterized protein n=1 Tax=Ganoderma sinense ZZ0214-1 TaxID=1077348 RepID=A0A2G8SRI2_9APHY|nr:hypothetical protein GSI_00040 [Ganoderma sinense ZZ0214-1]